MKLEVVVVGVERSTRKEVVIARQRRDDATMLFVDEAVRRAVEEATAVTASKKSGASGELTELEVSVRVSGGADEQIRPAFHLQRETIAILSAAGMDFDFDPYV